MSELERLGDVWVVESAISSSIAEMEVPLRSSVIREANLQPPNIFYGNVFRFLERLIKIQTWQRQGQN